MADVAIPAPRSAGHFRSLKPLLDESRVVLAGGFLIILALIAIFAPWIAPKSPLEQDLMMASLPPIGFEGYEPGYYLGTDDLGRDVLSRLIFGARIALTVALVAATLAGLVGSLLGLASGWYRGWTDRIVSRLVDIWMSFPPVLLSVLLVAVLGSGLSSVIIAIAIIDWTRFSRVVRAETLAQGGLDYVTAAESIGFSRRHILWREILPNVAPVIIALLSLEMGIAVIVEAILSFVGLSISSDAPTWGGMVAQGRQVLHESWWVLVFPLCSLFATVLAFNLLGNGLRKALDPVMRR
ncbi:ABC transporter permease [Kaistia dalseonensis]|uniref:Peptide/nickel transport system permease protein n=1 Tax=Kaistia dalseonensis TaxID=410840 RepID=A0ABU0H7E7_9HYPH|nr:ABC transporter permease [Kaistia dalseonensis]MCX5495640.1 ABC transporter permease [Kaistia dalseonensis]MDQ0438233.1 peptide/nickel transport system permease protein [Kaistia dalseonensis]